MFKPHPKDYDAETIRKHTRYIKTTAIATGTEHYRNHHLILHWTSRKNSLELIELSSINKVSLV